MRSNSSISSRGKSFLSSRDESDAFSTAVVSEATTVSSISTSTATTAGASAGSSFSDETSASSSYYPTSKSTVGHSSSFAPSYGFFSSLGYLSSFETSPTSDSSFFRLSQTKSISTVDSYSTKELICTQPSIGEGKPEEMTNEGDYNDGMGIEVAITASYSKDEDGDNHTPDHPHKLVKTSIIDLTDDETTTTHKSLTTISEENSELMAKHEEETNTNCNGATGLVKTASSGIKSDKSLATVSFSSNNSVASSTKSSKKQPFVLPASQKPKPEAAMEEKDSQPNIIKKYFQDNRSTSLITLAGDYDVYPEIDNKSTRDISEIEDNNNLSASKSDANEDDEEESWKGVISPPALHNQKDMEQAAAVAEEKPAETPMFQRGDHVYQWCSLAGVPYVYQHHGIVMHCEMVPGDTEGEFQQELTIADFSNFLPEPRVGSSTSSGDDDASAKEQQGEDNEKVSKKDGSDATESSPPNKKAKGERHSFLWSKSESSFVGMGASTGGILRVYTTTTDGSSWHKVEYGAPRWKTMLSRSGVSTSVVASDPPEVVLNRVNFLLVQAEREANDTFRSSILPEYHVIFANCECVATWCKTGKWATLQGAAGLAGATWGGTVAIGRAAAAQEAAVATPGLMSYLSGASMAAGPSWVVPAVAAYGAITIGGSTGTLLLARSKWDATTKLLNKALEEEHQRVPPLNV